MRDEKYYHRNLIAILTIFRHESNEICSPFLDYDVLTVAIRFFPVISSVASRLVRMPPGRTRLATGEFEATTARFLSTYVSS